MATRIFHIATNDRAILAHRFPCFDAASIELDEQMANLRAIELARDSRAEVGKVSRIFRQNAQRLWDLFHDAYDPSVWDALDQVDKFVNEIGR